MSREAAWDYLKVRVRDGWDVLDVGAGESPFTGWLIREKRCRVTATDIREDRLRAGWLREGRGFDIIPGDILDVRIPLGRFDAAIAAYSLCTMVGFEPMVWVKIRRWLKPGGIFLGLTRYQIDAPQYEGNRGDPMFGLNEALIRGLAILTLFEVVDTQGYRYQGTQIERVAPGSADANAIGYQLRAVER